jgi:2-polyprenyl-6-methoxyphenol hydroxylase-like FAD-dependent oxidoreductase
MKQQHAIVMGGSIAGLLAARVLSDFYQQVTIVERDAFPSGAAHRRGVPHARHTHGLLAGGHDVLERLFPGITLALIAQGGVSGDIVRDFRWFFEGGCLSRPASGWSALLTSRPMLEAEIRNRVLALPNIARRDHSAVERLAPCVRSHAVTGVYVDGELLPADLVVDATGRGSHTPHWLRQMGYESPREESVQIGLSYTTRFFERYAGDLGGDLGAIIPPTPHGKRGGVMIAQEGGRWAVTLLTHFGEGAPEDLAGFVEFARTLPAPYIYDVIRDAIPVGEAATIKFPASVRRHYEGLSRFPSGYLVVGDALCSFNPIYGQGMSVAMLEAAELQTLLAHQAENLAGWFFARASKVVDTPWSIAVGNDLRMPEAVGVRSPGLRAINWYISRLHRAAHADPLCTLAFHKVGNLLAPPASIMHPRIAMRVLRSSLMRPSGRTGAAPYRTAAATLGE